MNPDHGHWWLAADRTHSVTGNLTALEDSSLRLQLDHHLVPWTDGDVVVWGETTDEVPVTLLGCVVLSSANQTQEVYVHVALIGIHIASADDAIFRELAVSLSNLTDWATRGRDAPLLPEQITNPECTGEHLSLRWVENEVRLVVESDEPRSWAGFGNTTQAFQDLLTLAGNADCRIESSVLSTDEGTPVEVRMTADNVIARHWHPVFVLGTVSDEFISNWLTLRAKLGMSGSVLFSLDYGGRGYFQNKLFNAASAAEGFHEVLYPEATGISDQDYTVLKNHIKALPDSPARQWALSAIQRNQPGLSKRMHELAAIPDSEAVARVLHDQKKWVNWIVNARNAIGHSSWDGMGNIPRELRPALTYVTKTLLHLVIFEQLGLSAEQQRSAAAVSHLNLRQRYDDYFDPASTA